MRNRIENRTSKPRRWSRLLAVAAASTVLALGACNTMEGMGEDMQAAGSGIEEEANEANR